MLSSINPSTEEVISTTKGASLEDYENTISAMMDARKDWAAVTLLLLRCQCLHVVKSFGKSEMLSGPRRNH